MNRKETTVDMRILVTLKDAVRVTDCGHHPRWILQEGSTGFHWSPHKFWLGNSRKSLRAGKKNEPVTKAPGRVHAEPQQGSTPQPCSPMLLQNLQKAKQPLYSLGKSCMAGLWTRQRQPVPLDNTIKDQAYIVICFLGFTQNIQVQSLSVGSVIDS